MLDVFTIGSPALPKDTRVVGFRGAEGISRPYAFEIHLSLAPDERDAFELAAAVAPCSSPLGAVRERRGSAIVGPRWLPRSPP
jgi:hypothetical protein